MAVATVTVNSSFFAEMKQDNKQLLKLINQLLVLCTWPWTRLFCPKTLLALVDDLRGQLALRFSLEETFGYLGESVLEQPGLSVEAEQLRAQHEVLYADLCRIAEIARDVVQGEAPPASRQLLVDHLRAFRSQFQEHESCEEELFHRAYGSAADVGA